MICTNIYSEIGALRIGMRPVISYTNPSKEKGAQNIEMEIKKIKEIHARIINKIASQNDYKDVPEHGSLLHCDINELLIRNLKQNFLL